MDGTLTFRESLEQVCVLFLGIAKSQISVIN